MDTMDRSPVTNQRVGEDLGVSHSMISRIRSGDREPSIHLMMRIRDVLDWDITSQATAIGEGDYGVHFEAILIKHYHG